MSLVISQEVIKASGLSEDELLKEIVIMLFQQDKISGSSLPFMLNQQTRCQDNILLTQKFRKFLKP
jgi:hypothetical protein